MNISIRPYEDADWERLGQIHDRARLDELRNSVDLAAFLPLADTAPSGYRILVSVSTQRPTADLYQVSIRQPLPDIPIPLKQSDQPVMVHLQTIIAGVYTRGRYHSRINYKQPPPPPQLSEADQQWRLQLT